MGYADTGASPHLADYSFKSHADAIAGIAAENKISRAAIGGHDWGGILVYRVAQWYPQLITHIFSVCTAFVPVNEGKFVSTRELAGGVLPQFGYQLQFGSEEGEVERAVDGKEGRIRKFLNGLYGGKVKGGRKFMDPRKGVELDVVRDDSVEGVAKTPLMSEDVSIFCLNWNLSRWRCADFCLKEIDYYVSQFQKHGIHGPCNWYRTRKINYDEEKNMPAENRKIIKQPTLYILATKDDVLTREMSRGMEKTVPNLTRGEVPAGHWALWQTPDQVNAILKNWIESVVLGGKSKL